MVDFVDINTIGLTGMSGAGKSTASRALLERGFYIIDCDYVANRVIARSPCIDAVAEKFPDIFTEDLVKFGKKIIDRKKAAEFLFANPKRLSEYQGIVFPYISYEILAFMRIIAEAGQKNIVLDAATLFQSGADDLCDRIVAVTAAKETCIRRITARDSISEKNAEMRLKNQFNEEFYRKNCDIVIENNGMIDVFLCKIMALTDFEN